MKFSRRITSLLLALVMLLGIVPLAAVAEDGDIPVLAVNSLTAVTVPEGGVAVYRFTTDSEGGTYRFVSLVPIGGRADPNIAIYTEEEYLAGGGYIGYNEDYDTDYIGSEYDEYNFTLDIELEANTDYFIEFGEYEGGEVTYDVKAVKAVKATGVSIAQGDEVSGYVGAHIQLNALFLPEIDGTVESVEWKSDKESVATVDSDGLVSLLKEGTATVTVTSENGLTDSIEVTVLPLPELTVGEAAEAVISNEGDYMYFAFTPEADGYYYFYSEADRDTYGYLYDSEMNELVRNDDGYINTNFLVRYMLEADKEYIYGARFYSSSYTGSFNVYLEKVEYLTKIEVTSLPEKNEYVRGYASQALDYSGLEMKLTWSDGSVTDWSYDDNDTDINDYESFDVDSSSIDDDGTVTVSWNDVTTSFNMTLIDNPVDHIEIYKGTSVEYIVEYGGYIKSRWDEDAQEDVDYYHYDVLDHSDAQIKVVYKDGTSDIGNLGDDINGYYIDTNYDQSVTPWTVGSDNVITVSYLGFSTELFITVNENPVESIEVYSNEMAPYYEGYKGYWDDNDAWYYELNEPEGLVVKVNYTDGTSETSSATELLNGYSFELGSDQYDTPWTVGGENYAYVSYLNHTVDVPVTVLSNPVSSIELISAPAREYIWGDPEFGEYEPEYNEYYYVPSDLTGISFKVTYTDGTSKTFTDKDIQINVFKEEIYIDGTEGGLDFDYSPTIGTETVALYYYGNAVEYEVTVKETDVESIEIVKQPDNAVLSNYAISTFEGLELKATYKDGTTETITATNKNVSFDLYSGGIMINDGGKKALINIGDYNVYVNYRGVICELECERAEDLEIEEITVNGRAASNADGMNVTIKYADGTAETARLETQFVIRQNDDVRLIFSKGSNGYFYIIVTEAVLDDNGDVAEYNVYMFDDDIIKTTAVAACSEVIYGDVNMDGKVNVSDCILIKRSILQTYELTYAQELRANINEDARVNIADYILAKRTALKTYSKEFTGEYVDPYEKDIAIGS